MAGPSGPLRGRLTIRRRFEWPVGIDPRERVRTEATVPTDVITTLELQAGEPFVRVEVSFENRSRDHRVRFHVPLPGAATGSVGPGPVRRRRARSRGRGRTRRGAPGHLPGPWLRPDRGRQRAARSHRGVRGRRGSRAGAHAASVVRLDQPQRQSVPRGPGRSRGARARRAADRRTIDALRADAPHRLVGQRLGRRDRRAVPARGAGRARDRPGSARTWPRGPRSPT